MKNKAAFFDRDGTINVDNGYTYRVEDLEFINGIPELIKKYNDMGYIVIVITNQSGVARGYYTERDIYNFHNYMNKKLKELYSAHIDAFYYCPHHPDINGKCNCRKPNTGMIEKAIVDWNIDVKESVLYGDKQLDIECGEKCNIKSVLISDVRKEISI